MNMRLLRDEKGSGAAEFALVLPLLLILIFGIIDGGRWLWTYNRAVKATQVGARVAAVTQIIPGGLAASYVGVVPPSGTALTQGDVIPASALGKVSCSKPSGTLTCTCAPPDGAPPCPSPLTPINAGGWTTIYNRMKFLYPTITEANIVVDYSGSGLGYAGDPDGQDISPLISVRVKNLNFRPIALLALKSVQIVPAAATTLTAEDQLGSQSN